MGYGCSLEQVFFRWWKPRAAHFYSTRSQYCAATCMWVCDVCDLRNSLQNVFWKYWKYYISQYLYLPTRSNKYFISQHLPHPPGEPRQNQTPLCQEMISRDPTEKSEGHFVWSPDVQRLRDPLGNLPTGARMVFIEAFPIKATSISAPDEAWTWVKENIYMNLRSSMVKTWLSFASIFLPKAIR